MQYSNSNELLANPGNKEGNRMEIMISLFNSGKSYKEIAELFGIKWKSVRHYLYLRGFRTSNEILNDTDKEEVLRLYNNKVPIEQIALQFNCSEAPLYRCLKHAKATRTQAESIRKYHVNHDYFSEIDTEDKAYFLGFFYADGYNHQKKRDVSISMTLAEKDISVLECLRSKICPEKPFYTNYRNQKNPNWQNSVTLKINSKQLSDDLAKWGCTQAKTFTITFPENLPKELYSHFIRGYFDGDGYAAKNRFEIVGTEKFLLKIQEILIKELEIGKTKLHTRHKERDNNIRTLIYGGSNIMKKLHDYLYTDASYYLERKKSNFQMQEKA